MVTVSGQVRQGLPRVPGGEPWPPHGVAAQTEAVAQRAAHSAEPSPVQEHAAPVDPVVEPGVSETHQQDTEVSAPRAASPKEHPGPVLRQGLPRVPGGSPWPEGGVLPGAAAAPAQRTPEVTEETATAPAASLQASEAEPQPVAEKVEGHPVTDQQATPTLTQETQSEPVAMSDVPLRRGLPRVPGGEPWPPEGFAPVSPTQASTQPQVSEATPVPAVAPVTPAEALLETTQPTQPAAAPATETEKSHAPTATVQQAEPNPPAQAPPAQRTASTTEPTRSASPSQSSAATQQSPAKPKRETIMIGEKTLAQWVKLWVLGTLGAIVVAGILVLAARGLTTFTAVSEFMKRYPGEYALPESSEPGFPWWARWSHFLNIFLMVLIIRSGLLVRTQQKPPAYWTPKKGGKKISINLWLHTSLDVLWLVNGIIFVVLLFVSGHWMRIVPTSLEVFPNAISALIQYVTLDWPTENGWVNYNSLQQIMYFLVVFVATPLATITGLRMSEWWPEKADRLNRWYPAPLARALHFPTMLFFVAFIIVHVFLVFSTGALKNLNHMFTGTEAVNWTGFWLFALAIFLTAAGWFAMRPLVLAPIANLFGRVSNR